MNPNVVVVSITSYVQHVRKGRLLENHQNSQSRGNDANQKTKVLG